MSAVIVELRRGVDEPGEFLDWLIDRGYTLRQAAVRLHDFNSPRTQRLLREWTGESDR